MDFTTDLESWTDVFNNGPVCIFKWENITGEWPIAEVTGNIETLSGWSAAEFLSGSKCFADLIHEDDRDRIKLEDIEWAADNYVNNGISNYRIVTKTGEIRHVCEYSQGAFDDEGNMTHLVGYILDVAAVRDQEFFRINNEAQHAKGLLHEAIGAMAQGLVIRDREKILHANARVAELLDIPAEYFEVGRPWVDYIHFAANRGDYGEEVDPDTAVKNILSKMEGGNAYSNDRLTSSGKYIRADVQPRENGGGVITYTDVTDNQMHQLELEEARRSAQSADRAKSEFLANMSHEIRTPMNGVMGMAELLAKTELDQKQKTFADIIVKSGGSLLTIINDILDFSKIDAGQMELDPAPFNLAEAIEDVASLVAAKVAEKDLEFVVRVAPNLPGMFVGDVGRIRQVITNLIGNAVKFTEHGHVLVDIFGEVSESGEASLSFCVEDTGIGIPAEQCESIFEKFSQADGSATRTHEGTGLGLTISASLIELMGGEIGVESELGKGSTFRFDIKLPVHAGAPTRKQIPVDATGKRILIVDDNEVNRSILSEQLAAWKFDSAAVSSGKEALEMMQAMTARELKLDAVILDYHMPQMNGAAVAEIMNKDPLLKHIPIIMLTSVDQTESGKTFSSLGIHGHLVKPARSSLLLETILRVLQETHPETSSITTAVNMAKSIGALKVDRDPARLQPARACQARQI